MADKKDDKYSARNVLKSAWQLARKRNNDVAPEEALRQILDGSEDEFRRVYDDKVESLEGQIRAAVGEHDNSPATLPEVEAPAPVTNLAERDALRRLEAALPEPVHVAALKQALQGVFTRLDSIPFAKRSPAVRGCVDALRSLQARDWNDREAISRVLVGRETKEMWVIAYGVARGMEIAAGEAEIGYEAGLIFRAGSAALDKNLSTFGKFPLLGLAKEVFGFDETQTAQLAAKVETGTGRGY